MAMLALHIPAPLIEQRIQAARLYPSADVCQPAACVDGASTTPSCAHGGYPQFYKFGAVAEVAMYRALDEAELRRELTCRPVVFARENLEAGQRDGTGHMVVATGIGVAAGESWIAINDPDGDCKGERRTETYRQYLGGSSKVPWVNYYGIRIAGSAFSLCPDVAPAPEGPIPEADSPSSVVSGFIAAVQNNVWIRGQNELTGVLDCDTEAAPITEKTLSVGALKAAPPALGPVLVDANRLRFLCRDGTNKVFSVEAQQETSGKWRVVTMGDSGLATRLQEIRLLNPGREIEEVVASGLNVRFVRLLGPVVEVWPLYAFPEYGIQPAKQPENALIPALFSAASSFRKLGPT